MITNDIYCHIKDIKELPSHFLSELKHFFEQYKFLENKIVAIDEFQNATTAYTVIQAAIDLYKTKFPK